MTKTSDLSKLRSFFNNITKEKTVSALRSFFMGKWYPIWIAFSVLIGRFTCTELYFAMLEFVLVSVAILVCDSIRPLLPNLITFLYRIPLEHSPGSPIYSKYYKGEKMIVFAIFATVFFITLIFFFIKSKSFSGVNFLKLPLFIPTAIFALTFITAGIFSGNRQSKDLYFTLLQVFVFFVVLYILYLGLRKENFYEILDYFVYIATVCAGILILQVLDLYLRYDIYLESGSVDKYQVLFGWGISNNCANVISMLIPIPVIGAMRASKKHVAVIYIGMSALILLAAICTLSRSAAIFGSVAFIISIVVSSFVGNHKIISRIMMLACIVMIICVLLCFKDKILIVFNRYIEVGFSDGNRYRIWSYYIDSIKTAPIFGNGFFYSKCYYGKASFIPPLAHNTIIQLLASLGVVGLVAYLVYRVFTIIPFFKNFTATKLLLLGSCLILIFESLLDNFIFWFYPTFVYNICIVLAVMHCEQTKRERTDLDAQESAALVTELEGAAEEVENV